MHNLSLRLRSFAAAVLALLIFIPLTAVTLEQAFNGSLSQSMLQQLRVQGLTLISEFELDSTGSQAQMPEQLYNDQFNIPGSGLYAFIQSHDGVLWQSLSTLNWQQQPKFVAPDIGAEVFIEDFSMQNNYFLYAYTAEFESSEGYQPVSFYILQDKQVFNTEKSKFANTLWNWLGLIALLLLILLLFSLNAALLPISRLNKQIRQAESGQLKRIDQRYPPELEKLKNSINNLLDTEKLQRSRYKNSLSDLAHSLKTPLAVLAGTAGLPEQAKEPISQINLQIQRQLKRAVAGTTSTFEQAVAIEPVVDKLFNAMHKVYADKNLTLTHVIQQRELGFNGDITDLMEILGNVIDNACKAAIKQVTVTALANVNELLIHIEDDGPGIPKDKREQLLERGTRLDSYKEGQGIGMAVVADLVSAYQGQLEIKQSDFGGAKLTLIFPIKV
ncbi:ATP-binding protein [Paraglaciecola psychrophila]|uniref:histidine kinase n=1 Tax=Paraglaciecola psychrophila 170 TaxID=1129794 RepID=K7AJY3_9ALTE|nr:ATP-binding protein [Paraglaciecola psychrophila]AGH46102.1 sensor signal transduction histidine kinase [Paraglaciecola psychrophila 170]GAC35755.1 two-component system, OmpR family, sensor histidine kinase PhoQ [Paraglaciecola psychrophila 170]